jgi:hypothetical protein
MLREIICATFRNTCVVKKFFKQVIFAAFAEQYECGEIGNNRAIVLCCTFSFILIYRCA